MTTIDLLPEARPTAVGGSGVVAGVTGADGPDEMLAPAAFVAVTVNAYGVPLLSDPTSQVRVGAATAAQPVPPAGEEVTVQFVTAEPWVFTGANHQTLAVWPPTGVSPSRPPNDVSGCGCP